jgi:5-methylcytosine-specific restriction endonuclease McrA
MLRGRVLLLNQNFEILGTIGLARAMRMSLRKENPIVVHEYVPDRFLTSGSGQKFPVPSVISLKHFVNVTARRNESGAKREKIYLRDRYTCQYCSIKIGKKHPVKGYIMEKKHFTLDHVIPRSKGGNNLPSNLVTSCEPCNTRKADRFPDEANMPLRTQTHKITDVGTDKLNICLYLENNPQWIPYVQGREGYDELIEELGIATTV